MNRFLCLFLVPFVAAACADEVAPDDNNVIDQLGAGTMVINVSGLDSVAVGAMVKLIVDRTSSPAANNFVIKERPLEGALFVIDQVFVPEAVYRVTIEIRDSNGQVFLKGTTSGVAVLQGQTTSVTVVLEPSGAVQVVAELAKRPDLFLLTEFTSDDADPVTWLSGTQRVVSGAGGAQIEYVVLVQRGSGYSTHQRLGRAMTPLALLGDSADFEPVSGLNTMNSNDTLTAAGGALFVARVAYGTLEIRRSDAEEADFRPWASFPITPQLWQWTNSYTAVDTVGPCQTVIDNQLNVFCATRRVLGANSRRLGVTRSFSESGASWTLFPPYLDEDGSIVSGDTLSHAIEQADLAPILDALWVSKGPTSSTPANIFVMQDLGTYHIWLHGGGTSNEWVNLAYASSMDRRSWGHVTKRVVADADGDTFSQSTIDLAPYKGFAVFKTDAEATWQMIVVDKNGKRWLATSPVDE